MTAPDRAAAARAIDAFLRAIGRDPDREPHLAGTGARVTDAFLDELCDGYGVDLAAVLRSNAVDGRGELVIVRDVAVTTMCPHHLLPAMGTATIAFEPRAKLVGIGALVKLLDAAAHRLVLQEEIGELVVSTIEAELKPQWTGCRLVMRHACMIARGERRHDAKVETIAQRGRARADALVVLGAGG